MAEAVASADAVKAQGARRPLSLDLAIAVTTGLCSLLAVTGVWLDVDDRLSRGYQLRPALAVAVMAALGCVLILASRLTRDRDVLRAVAASELVLALAAVTVTTLEIARSRHYEIFWRPRAGAWSTLGFAIGWAALSVLRTIASMRGPAPVRVPAAPRSRVTPALVGAFLATLFLIIGAFGPWSYYNDGSSLNGLSGSYRGWVGLAGGLLSIVVLLAYLSTGRRPILTTVLIVAALSFGAAAADRNDIDKNNQYLTAGWGVNVTLAASLALFVAALAMMVFREPSLLRGRVEDAASPVDVVTHANWSRATSVEKLCPDCAETVKAAARVCRFCGYRFDAAG